MTRSERIENILRQSLTIISFELKNQSQQHSGHFHGDGETHFTLKVVAADFSGKSRIDRQRLINDLLKNEFATGLHALSIQAFAPDDKMAPLN